MKKVLIITYYWPPAGGAGVQRWLKFAKYMPQFGCEPIIYTPSNPAFDIHDESLLSEIPEGITILKCPIIEPHHIYRFFFGNKSNKELASGFPKVNKDSSLLKRISVWVRGNIFIPDARMWWISPSVRFLSKFIRENTPDVIITTGPPHSIHLIGLALKKRFNIKWIADFRDPWTGIYFYDDMLLTSYADRKHKRLEREVLTIADSVLTVGTTLASELKILGAKNVSVITNGFDEDDLPKSSVTLDTDFTISHIGTLAVNRNPEVLWKALQILKNEHPILAKQIKIKFVGRVETGVIQAAQDAGLHDMLQVVEYMPHKEITRIQASSRLLLLITIDTPRAKGILTGKFFEYLASGRPILAIGPEDGDVAELLKATGAGTIIDYNNPEGLKDAILQFMKQDTSLKTTNISQFSRKNLTAQLTKLI